MKDNLFLEEEAREKLMAGVKKVSNAVGKTMGTSGSNSLIEVIERPGQYATNDGFSIANAIRLANLLEEMGRKILLEAINRANRQSGDGSSTTCVLTSSILEEGMKYIGEYSPMEIKRSLEACIPVIEESVKAQKKDITVDNVGAVASISAEDEKIGGLIQEIYQKIGPNGIISWDVSKTSDDSYTIGTGLTIHGATYITPYMCDITDDGNLSSEVRWSNPLVLLTRQKISSSDDLNGIFGTLYAKDIRELVIFCDEIEVPVIADLVKTRAIKGFKSLVIKMPVLWRDEWWEDLALASGATVVGVASGVNLKNVTLEHLGTFGHINVTREDTMVDGIKDIRKHILALQVEGSEQSLLRASRLNTATARYFVGGYSESSIAYRRLKVEDAIAAAGRALEGGVVPGGGVALTEASKVLPDSEVGGKILKEALKAPMLCIISNFGTKGFDVSSLPSGSGLNSKTGKVESMLEANIIDPTDVVLNAIRNAIGVAASILTVGTVVTLPREDVIDPRNMPALTR